MTGGRSSKDLSRAALFGAAGVLLPVIFHALHLGHVFMPMYLPLIALAFFAGPRAAAATGFLVPLLSGALTGMPPFYPPLAPVMALEIASMGGALATLRKGYPAANEWLLLIPVLLLGRVLNYGLTYAAALLMDLPAGFLAGLSFLAGWPGLILITATVPPLVRSIAPNPAATAGKNEEK
jgi:hypothetical protein